MQDLGILLKQRDKARDWISLGKWAAIVIAGFGCLSNGVASERTISADTLARLLVYVLIGVAGALLEPGRRWASCLLTGLVALTFVLSIAAGTLSSGIIPRLIAVGICVRGALSVFKHLAIERLIDAAKAENEKGVAAECESRAA